MKTTHIALILDRSGSMVSSAEEAVNNYNDQVRMFQQMAKDTAGTAEIKVSLITFATEVFEHLWEVPANDLQECKQGDFQADGWTAMLDGIGYTVEKFRETTDYNNPDNNYMVVIITDGQENKSQHYKWTQEFLSEAQIKAGHKPDPRLPLDELMKPLEANGRWTFSFMGCDRTYITEAADRLAVPVANCAVWDNKTAASAKLGYRRSNKKMYAAALNVARGVGGSSACNAVYGAMGACGPAGVEGFDADFNAVDLEADPAFMASKCSTGEAAVFSTGNKVTSWKA